MKHIAGMIFACNKADGVHDTGISICLIMIIINSKHKESTYMPHLINVVVNNRLMDFLLMNLSLSVRSSAGSQFRAQRALRPAGAFHRTHTEGARDRQTHPTKCPRFQLYSSSSFSPTGKCRQKETRPAHCCERRVPIASLRGSFRDHSRKACGCAPRGLPAALGARREGSPGALRAS